MDQENGEANLAAAWEKVRTGLRRDLGHQIYGQWIKPITLAEYNSQNGQLDLEFPSEFMMKWVRDRYGERLSLAWKSIEPAVQVLDYKVSAGAVKLADLGNANVEGTAIGDNVRALHTPADRFAAMLDPRMTFASFVEGDSNRLALRAAQRMATLEAPLFNPLYLQAATGQGKTHLLQAIGHALREVKADARVIYMPAEKFMVEFVSALKRNDSMEFKSVLRRADLFMIDDIQFIVGKTSTQEEFLHTLDALAAQGKRVVVSCDRAPHALDGIDQRLLSRLAQGLVADIQPAGLELRREILEHRVGQLPQANLQPEILEFLARSISRNVRELEGALNKLIAYAQLTGQPVSRELAESQLSDILTACRRRITIDEIQRAVCEYYRIDRQEMSSKRRARAIARPRQVAMYLSKLMTPRSYPEIGRKFGNRDHSTVIHAVRLVEQLRAEDSEMDNDVRMLLRQLES